MTIAIVIGTHGWAAEQLLKTAEMLLGEQENVDSMGLVPGQSVDDLREKAFFAPVRDRYKVYNIGNQRPVELMTFINTIEKVLGKEAKKNFLPMQPGDVLATFADVDDLKRDIGFSPSTSLETGIGRWADWFREYVGKGA